MGNEQSVKLIDKMSTVGAETDYIQKTLFFIDQDDDAMLLFNTRSQTYAISIICRGSSNLGWKECKAIAYCMRVAAAGTVHRLQIFNSLRRR